MAKELDAQLVDRRTVERNIDKGLLTKKAYESYLGGLADKADNVEYVSLQSDEDADEATEESAES